MLDFTAMTLSSLSTNGAVNVCLIPFRDGQNPAIEEGSDSLRKSRSSIHILSLFTLGQNVLFFLSYH